MPDVLIEGIMPEIEDRRPEPPSTHGRRLERRARRMVEAVVAAELCPLPPAATEERGPGDRDPT